MKRSYLFVFLSILFLYRVVSASTFDIQSSHHHATSKRHGASFQAPGRRVLLSDAIEARDTALVAELDGKISLLEVGSLKRLWSFSSGPEIYSSYQAPINDKGNVTGLQSSYFIDIGDDWELYAHSSLAPKQKLTTSVEEYVNSTPQILEGGGIVLGSVTTTAFQVNYMNGRVKNKYSLSDSSTAMQYHVDDFPHNTTVDNQHQSGHDLTTSELMLYITRTDHTLTSFTPNSSEVAWNVTVAKFSAAFLCQGIDDSIGVTLLNSKSSEPGVPYNLPLPCESRALIYRFRDRNVLETLYMINALPKANQQDMMLPASTSNALPEQPNVGKLTVKFHNAHNSTNGDAIVPLNALNGSFRVPLVRDTNAFPNDSLMIVNGSVSTSMWILLFISLLIMVFFHHNFMSKIKLKLAARSTGTNDLHSKRKKPRKSGKGGNKSGKQDKGENEINHTYKESEHNFWVNLDQPISYGSAGRRVGKLFVSNEEIAKGSNGTIVLEGIYQGRPVAVKRLVRAYNDIALKEIQNLLVSDQHPNIIRWYGVEQDSDFVYLALERCICNLNDLILMHMKASGNSLLGKKLDAEVSADHKLGLNCMKGFMQDIELWKSDGYPSPLLLKLMRDVISGIAHLHEIGIVHRDLKPQNVLIISERSLCAKVSDMGISKRLIGDMSSFSNHATGSGSSGWQAPEQLLHGRQTRAVDMFSLGCVLFFCITGGRHPFGDQLERDSNVVKSKVDLFLVEHIPEAMDLFLRLLHPDAEMRPKALEVLCHPLFWNTEMRLSFLRDTSDRVELEDREMESELLKELESTATVALGGKWSEKMEPSFLNNIGRYRRYKYESVRDLLRVMRNKLNHYRELPAEIQEVIGPVPEGFDRYFTSRFPKLLVEVYKVVLTNCTTEEWFAKYFKSMEE